MLRSLWARTGMLVLISTMLLIGGCDTTPPPSPPPLGLPRVRVGVNLLSKYTFASPSIGTITDLCRTANGQAVIASGTEGASEISKVGVILATAPYAAHYQRVTVVPGRDWKLDHFLIRGSRTTPTSLLASNGTTVWTAPTEHGIADAIAGDLNGTGSTECAIAYSGAGGVSVYNTEGQLLWNHPDHDLWHIEMTAPDAKGQRLIVTNSRMALTVYTSSGKVISRALAPISVSSFSLCRWPSTSSPELLLSPSQAGYDLLTLQGKVIKQLVDPGANSLNEAFGVPIALVAGKPDYLAVLATASDAAWSTAVLYVFDSSGKIVYKEIEPEDCASLTVLPGLPGKSELLLVGGTNNIYEYAAGL